MKNKIIDVLNVVRPEFDFSESASFINDGLLDSFDLIALVTGLDDKFDNVIKFEKVKGFSRIGS